MMSTVLIALLTILVVGYNATDYCNKNLCPGGGTHIGCKNPNKFSSRCEEQQLIDFGIGRQKIVLDTHNKFRNIVASGVSPFTSAVRMRVLTWNKELAKLAEYNVRQCAMKQDDCLNTYEFPVAGQNLGYSGVRYSRFSNELIEPLMGRIMDNWFAESESVHQAWLDRFTDNTYDYVIFHFTTMMQDRGTEIGCSAVTHKVTVKGEVYITLLMACNYSFTNIINHPVYISGHPASKCLTGHDPYFTSLCSASENISTYFQPDIQAKQPTRPSKKIEKYHFRRKCK